MNTISLYDAKTKLSSIVAEVERSGAGVTICRHGRPVAELVPVSKRSRSKVHPELKKVVIKKDPRLPTTEEWDLV